MNPGYHFSAQPDKVSALKLFEKRRPLTRYEHQQRHCVDCSHSTILLTAGDVITLAFLVCALALESFILLTCYKSVGSLLCPLVPTSIQRQL